MGHGARGTGHRAEGRQWRSAVGMVVGESNGVFGTEYSWVDARREGLVFQGKWLLGKGATKNERK